MTITVNPPSPPPPSVGDTLTIRYTPEDASGSVRDGTSGTILDETTSGTLVCVIPEGCTILVVEVLRSDGTTERLNIRVMR